MIDESTAVIYMEYTHERDGEPLVIRYNFSRNAEIHEIKSICLKLIDEYKDSVLKYLPRALDDGLQSLEVHEDEIYQFSCSFP